MPRTGPFPRSERVLRRRDFLSVRAARCRARIPGLRLEWLATGDATKRVGFTVTKFGGNAPLRNRIKRLLREAWRHEREQYPHGRDYVFVPESPELFTDLAMVRNALGVLAQRLRTRS